MHNKKIWFAGLVCAIMALSATSVMAQSTTPVTPNPICTVENCQEVGAHYHDGTLYCDHNAADGHQYCGGQNGCTGQAADTAGRGYGHHGGGHGRHGGGRHCR